MLLNSKKYISLCMLLGSYQHTNASFVNPVELKNTGNNNISPSNPNKVGFIQKAKDVVQEESRIVKAKAKALLHGNESLEIKMDYLTKLVEMVFIFFAGLVLNTLIYNIVAAVSSSTTGKAGFVTAIIINILTLTAIVLRAMDVFSLNSLIMKKNINQDLYMEKKRKKEELIQQSKLINAEKDISPVF